MKKLNWQKVSDTDWSSIEPYSTAYVVTNNNPNIFAICHRVWLDKSDGRFVFSEDSSHGFSQFIENCDLWVLASDFDDFIKETLPK